MFYAPTASVTPNCSWMIHLILFNYEGKRSRESKSKKKKREKSIFLVYVWWFGCTCLAKCTHKHTRRWSRCPWARCECTLAACGGVCVYVDDITLPRHWARQDFSWSCAACLSCWGSDSSFSTERWWLMIGTQTNGAREAGKQQTTVLWHLSLVS